MKKSDLIKRLKEMGARLLREGRHEVWESRNGYRFPVPRHKEINEHTAKQILKQAEK